jgi:hypothetical protein
VKIRRLRFLILFLLATLLTVQLSLNAQASTNSMCPRQFRFTELESLLEIPYCSNYPINIQQPGIRRAVIIIHGTNRNANNYYDYIESAAQQSNQSVTTIIIAPQFLTEEDITNSSLNSNTLFWDDDGWKQGDHSLSTPANPRSTSLSSFTVIDKLLTQLSNPNLFPDLTDIVIAGHSAGGQFVNRLAAGSQAPQQFQNDTLQIRYIVANPSSYLYFSPDRFIPDNPEQFVIPDRINCPTYNQYKYGLEALNPYMAAVGEQTIREQYPQRNVIYLLGEEDNDPNALYLDKSCAAMVQGRTRLERGEVYYRYLVHYVTQQFSQETMQLFAEQQKRIVIPGVGHSANDMFHSTCGKALLFDTDSGLSSCDGRSPSGIS